MPRSPLPLRHGLNAAWIRTAVSESAETMRDHLVERLPMLPPTRVDEMLAEGRFVTEQGAEIDSSTPFRPNRLVFFHRDLPNEDFPPGELTVLHRDERLAVLDKPHFTSTIPRGQHVLHSAVVRARRELDLPELSPAHRLDRLTAGVLLCTTERQWRGAYQSMFEQRLAQKSYLAITHHRRQLVGAVVVSSHIVKTRGVLQARELPDQPPNAHTVIEPVRAWDDEIVGPLLMVRVTLRTGRTHQIRLHLNSLGCPIVNDPFYPVLREVDRNDFTAPLQLLAERLSFTDPLDDTERSYLSRRTLSLAPLSSESVAVQPGVDRAC